MFPLLMTVASGKWPGSEKLKVKNEKLDEFLTFHFSFFTLLRLCFTNPNRIFRLGKQGIVEGAPADLILVDPKKEWVIKGKELHSKCGWSPFEGWRVIGRVQRVLT